MLKARGRHSEHTVIAESDALLILVGLLVQFLHNGRFFCAKSLGGHAKTHPTSPLLKVRPICYRINLQKKVLN